MSLVLGIIWLLIGVVLLAWHAFTNDPRMRLPFAGNLSLGWLALVLAAYNFVRWWSQRALQQEQRRLQFLKAKIERSHWDERRAAYDNPDPTFQFHDEPPPPAPNHIQPPEEKMKDEG
jgi:hypothetical protein